MIMINMMVQRTKISKTKGPRGVTYKNIRKIHLFLTCLNMYKNTFKIHIRIKLKKYTFKWLLVKN